MLAHSPCFWRRRKGPAAASEAPPPTPPSSQAARVLDFAGSRRQRRTWRKRLSPTESSGARVAQPAERPLEWPGPNLPVYNLLHEDGGQPSNGFTACGKLVNVFVDVQ